MSGRRAIRRELFPEAAARGPGYARVYLVGYLDGIDDWYPRHDSPRRRLLIETAREWLAELDATARDRDTASSEELEAAGEIWTGRPGARNDSHNGP